MIDIFKEELQSKDIHSVYRKYLLGHKIWYFETKLNLPNHADTYDNFKVYMSERLNLHVNNIAIVGSAKIGFSLSPTKNYKLFDDDSDIDLVIVSRQLFRQSWDAFLELSNRFHVPFYNSVTSNIFRRFVFLKDPDIRNDFFSSWVKKVDPCKKDIQTIFGIPHDINYRIYESWESVENYHINSLSKLKSQMEADNA